jgi:hypothetical protein
MGATSAVSAAPRSSGKLIKWSPRPGLVGAFQSLGVRRLPPSGPRGAAWPPSLALSDARPENRPRRIATFLRCSGLRRYRPPGLQILPR